MKIVSDNCHCSSCTEKYYCPEYALIITIQNLAKKLLKTERKGIQIVIQVEKCPYKKTRKTQSKKKAIK